MGGVGSDIAVDAADIAPGGRRGEGAAPPHRTVKRMMTTIRAT